MADVRIGEFIVTYTPDFKPGDPAPEGYVDWHAWAEVQHKAGLRQTECPGCGKWQFPQELSTIERTWNVTIGRWREPQKRSAFLCLKCAEMAPNA